MAFMFENLQVYRRPPGAQGVSRRNVPNDLRADLWPEESPRLTWLRLPNRRGKSHEKTRRFACLVLSNPTRASCVIIVEGGREAGPECAVRLVQQRDAAERRIGHWSASATSRRASQSESEFRTNVVKAPSYCGPSHPANGERATHRTRGSGGKADRQWAVFYCADGHAALHCGSTPDPPQHQVETENRRGDDPERLA